MGDAMLILRPTGLSSPADQLDEIVYEDGRQSIACTRTARRCLQAGGCEFLRAIVAGLEASLRRAEASGPLSRWLDCWRRPQEPFRGKRRRRMKGNPLP